MARLLSHLCVFMLFFCVCFPKTTQDRRFSDFKRCADEQCSMLLCRGKAAKDFTGPDCRFLSFKKGETIYVYYKLAGQRSDLWAGSVGSNFGYFPKDFLDVNHIYTEKEVEEPAEETDFVCFDTELNKFESYDVDLLLSKSLLLNEDDKSDEITQSKDPGISAKDEGKLQGESTNDNEEIVQSERDVTAEDVELPLKGAHKDTKEIAPSEDEDSYPVEDKDIPQEEPPKDVKEVAQSDHAETTAQGNETSLEEYHEDVQDNDIKVSESSHKNSEADETEDGGDINDLEPIEPSPLESTDTDNKESDIVKDPVETHQLSKKSDPEQMVTKKMQSDPSIKDTKVLEKIDSDHVSQMEALPELRTTLGTTFDAVTSDDANTQKVTPYYDEKESDTLVEPNDETEDGGDINDLEPIEPSPLESTDTDNKESDIVKDAVETHQLSKKSDPEQMVTKKMQSDPSIKDTKVLEKIDSDHVSQMEALPELRTTLGTTFDAVTSDDANTQKVTPYYDEKESDTLVEPNSEPVDEDLKELPLLSFEKEHPNFEDRIHNPLHSSGSDIPEESAEETQKHAIKSDTSKDDNIWSSLGNTVFNIVSGGERSDHPEDSDEEEEEEEEEEEVKVKAEEEEEEEEEEDGIDTDGQEKESLDQLEAQESGTTEETDVNNSSVTEDLSNEGNYNEVPEQDPIILKHKDEITVVEGNKESELSKSSSDLETLNYAVPESEHDIPEEPVEMDTEIAVQKRGINAQSQIGQSQEHPKDGSQSGAQLDNRPDEHTNNDIHEFKDKFKTEKNVSEIDELEVSDENEEPEELLEDENAVLSANAEVAHQSEQVKESEENSKPEAKLENSDVMHKQTTENISKQTNEEQTKTSLDLSTHHKENDKQSVDVADETQQNPVSTEEPKYSDSVLRLTLLRQHFKDDEMERIQRYLSLKDLFRVEALFSELEEKLKSVRESDSEAGDDMEKTLESILEISENSILDEIEKMLDTKEQRARDLGQPIDPVMFDEESAILDDFQELAFYLRQKYSAVSDSVPLVEESQSEFGLDNLNTSNEEEASVKNIPVVKASGSPEIHDETELSNVHIEEGKPHSQDLDLEEDGGHFNKNKDIQAGFKDTEDIEKGPQAILENPLDVTLSFEMDPSSDSSESPKTSDFYDSKSTFDQVSTSASDYLWRVLALASEFLGVYAEIMINALPEEWRPDSSFHGLPWMPVVATAAVGFITIVVFFWSTILSVKSRMYLLTEKQLAERIQQLVKEKSDVLLKVTELNNTIKQQEEEAKNSEQSRSSVQQEFDELKARYQVLQSQKDELSTNISHLSHEIADSEEKNKSLSEKLVIMHKRIEKYQNTMKVYEQERTKAHVLMDEAKLREDALKAEVLSFEKDNNALKEQKLSLLRDAKDWQKKHEKLSEEIKVYHKTQKDLEDTIVHKENEIDVLSSCIAELKGLEACDASEPQKGNAKLANGEAADNKGDLIKLRLKQMMDVSRIKATVSVIEDERNRYLENFMTEQKARQELEERFQQVIHNQTNLKNEKTHLESLYKNLQQKLEIITELYQQKESALQQKLTQEELERREKETKLSEVDSRALQAEEELNILRQKVKDMQEEIQQNERALKAEIAVQEKKAHENWLKARTSERALIEERREGANLRQKILECSDRISDLERTLCKSGPPDRHMPPLRRAGDSFGPSPVSGGAPSPPLMIEGPGRPPSAPVGRRNESFGPRPPSDPHGRFSELGNPLPSRPEFFAPRTSSPCTQDGSFQLSKSQSHGSFLPSPVRDSPGPALNAAPKTYGPPPPSLPPNGSLPPVNQPPSGHLPKIPPGPPIGPDPRFRPPHIDSFGPLPPRPFGPIPPPYACGPPLKDLPPIRSAAPPFDFPPDFDGPRNLPFPPPPHLSYPPGPLLLPRAMGPPPFSGRDLRGPFPPMAHGSRDREEDAQVTGNATDGPLQQVATQDTNTTAMAEP